MKIVRVSVEGGVIQWVEVPEGVTVIVHDYDVDDSEEDLLQQDDHGDKYVESVWEHE